MIKNILSCIALAMVFASCSSTNTLTMGVLQPSTVYLPQKIQRIGIINRSLPNQNKKLDDVDKVLSLEGKNLDKEGAEAAISALANELGVNNRFNSVIVFEEPSLKSPGLGVFPAPILWEKVEEICKARNVEALFELCYYDTDTRVDYQANQVEVKGPLGVVIPAIEHVATVYTTIKMGWRIYDPMNRVIRDEYNITDNVVQSGRGINPIVAVQAVTGRKEAVLQRSNQIGRDYAVRIIPYYIRVTRNYYVRGTNNFKIAKRRAQTGNWDGAAELWKLETENSKPKVVGRAMYNMAIINEINGDLDAAINWASKAYADYENKLALDYLRILKNRKATQLQIEQESQ
jgi:hypothetical protein